MAGPTADSAKLVPCFPSEFSPELPSPPGLGFGRVFMGRYPVGEADLRKLLQAKVSVFVNLREELADSMYTGENPTEYPSIVKRLVADEFPGTNVTFIHFKILDFKITAPGYMLELIRELEKLVYAGHVVYIHCAGGHGRTGQVAINLLEALYALDLSSAQSSAIAFHQARPSGKCVSCHDLPETPVQQAQLALIAPMAARERALVLALATPSIHLHAEHPAAPAPVPSPAPVDVAPAPAAPTPAVATAPAPAPAPAVATADNSCTCAVQ